MATVVNNPSDNSGSSMGVVFGIILLLVIAFVFFIYGLPMLSGVNSGPQLNVPSTVNVQTK